MSGGTDSSIAALLLQRAGYEVIGVTFRFYEHDGRTDYLEKAVRLSEELHIHHEVHDYRESFRKEIITYFIDEYMAGRTPVPCTVCNNRFKWRLLAEIADTQNCNYIATGHYAQVRFYNRRHYIYKGTDPDKDQSFFLWGLPEEWLQRIVFPLGNYTKTYAKSLIENTSLEQAVIKKESTGVCFCPDDYRTFLRREVKEPIRPGFYRDSSGKIIGKHEGYPFYTVGQRRGLGVRFQYPIYVKEIIPARNEVVLAPLQELYYTQMTLFPYHLVDAETDLVSDGKTICKIRYRKQATPCNLMRMANGELKVELLEPLHAIAEGQAAAFYRGDRVIGGGIIAGKQ